MQLVRRAEQRCACCGHERQSQKRLVQELIVGSLDARWMQSMKAYTSVKLVKTAKGRVDAAQRRPTIHNQAGQNKRGNLPKKLTPVCAIT